jgi:hypothetical protein
MAMEGIKGAAIIAAGFVREIAAAAPAAAGKAKKPRRDGFGFNFSSI